MMSQVIGHLNDFGIGTVSSAFATAVATSDGPAAASAGWPVDEAEAVGT